MDKKTKAIAQSVKAFEFDAYKKEQRKADRQFRDARKNKRSVWQSGE